MTRTDMDLPHVSAKLEEMTEAERVKRLKDKLRARLDPPPPGTPVAFDYCRPDDYVPLLPWELGSEAPTVADVEALRDWVRS